MDKDLILHQLRDVFCAKLRIESNPASITEATNLIASYGIDSLKIITLMMELENTFDIMIDPSEINIETLTDVGNLIAFISDNVNGPQAATT